MYTVLKKNSLIKIQFCFFFNMAIWVYIKTCAGRIWRTEPVQNEQ